MAARSSSVRLLGQRRLTTNAPSIARPRARLSRRSRSSSSARRATVTLPGRDLVMSARSPLSENSCTFSSTFPTLFSA